MLSFWRCLASLAVLAVSFTLAESSSSAALTQPSIYIVQLVDPVARAARPSFGGQRDGDGLTARQAAFRCQAEQLLGRSVVVQHSYRLALNGLAMALEPEEARRIAGLSGVASVVRSELRPLATDVGPAWIGAPGIWDGSSTQGAGASRGEGVVVGVIDTGIQLDHPAFAAVGEDGYRAVNPLAAGHYLGYCDPGHPAHRTVYRCNDKLIGAWSFPEVGNDPIDDHGHGSHTAATAAGNLVTATLFPGSPEPRRQLSGVAPHANIIAYDACRSDGYCPDATTVAAVEQAIRDGVVDVLNFSIDSSDRSPWQSPLAIAFQNARRAGIIVVAAAGNDGPAAGSVGATAPWVLSVGATSHGRLGTTALEDLRGGEGAPPAAIPGLAYTGAYGPAPIVHARGYRNGRREADDGRCSTSFATGVFDGQIVVCDRGAVAPVEAGRNVRAGGAGGLIVVNGAADGETLRSDWHVLPAIHIGFRAGEELKAWLLEGSGHSGRIVGTRVAEEPRRADVVAGFSGRGPTPLTDCCYGPQAELSLPARLDVLKPDLVAPGVDILAAAKTLGGIPSDRWYQTLSGTSMAAPHVAGAAALLRAVHRDWTPAEIQSALMLTALSEGVRHPDDSAAGPLARGAGRIDLRAAGRSPAVMPIHDLDYAAADPKHGGEPRDLNLPSLYDSACISPCAWRRTVVGTTAATVSYSAAVATSDGLQLVVAPARFRLARGTAQSLAVTAVVAPARLATWQTGEVRLEPDDGQEPTLRLPVAVRSVRARVPERMVIEARAAVGEERLTGLRAASEELYVGGLGWAPAVPHRLRLGADPSPADPYDRPPAVGNGVATVPIVVPAGARRLVAEVTASGAQDVDLFLGRDANGDGRPEATEEVCASTGESWPEYCAVADPPAGDWWLVVQCYAPSDHPPDPVTVQTGVLLPKATTALLVNGPSRVGRGQPFSVAVGWRLPMIEVGDRFYGLVTLGSAREQPEDLATVPVNLVAMTEAVGVPSLYLPIASRDWPRGGE